MCDGFADKLGFLNSIPLCVLQIPLVGKHGTGDGKVCSGIKHAGLPRSTTAAHTILYHVV